MQGGVIIDSLVGQGVARSVFVVYAQATNLTAEPQSKFENRVEEGGVEGMKDVENGTLIAIQAKDCVVIIADEQTGRVETIVELWKLDVELLDGISVL